MAAAHNAVRTSVRRWQLIGGVLVCGHRQRRQKETIDETKRIIKTCRN